MLRIFTLLFLTSLVSTAFAQNEFGYKEGYNLVWHDEFIDSNLTNNQWDRQFPFGPMCGAQTYAPRYGTVEFNEGKINLLNKKEKINGEVYDWDSAGNFKPYFRDFDYQSGMLWSKKEFLHGYFEASFRSDPGKGFFNAFWLFGEKKCEIDVFELAGSDPHDAQMTLHWKDKDPISGSSQSIAHMKAEKHFGEVQHTFASEWTANDVKWFHNDVEVPQTAYARWIRRRHIPDVPLHVIINSSIATLDGPPDSTTVLPGKISFDHVRIYQNEQVVTAPEITGQEQMKYLNYLPTGLSLLSLMVSDHYKTYPYGFKYEILPGSNYSTDGVKYTVVTGYKGVIQLNVRVNDGINWSGVKVITVNPDSHLGVGEQLDGKSGFILYPNPSHGSFTISRKGTEKLKLMVSSLDGRTLLSDQLLDEVQQFDVTGLSSGIYLLTLLGSSGINFAERIIIE